MSARRYLFNFICQRKESHLSLRNRWCRPCVLAWLITLLIFIPFVDSIEISSTTGLSDCDWPPPTEAVNGTLTDIQGISILRIWGSPFEKGYAHGYLLAEDIATILNNFIAKSSLGMDADTWKNKVIPAIGSFTIEQRFKEELQGMLAGMEARVGKKVNIPSLGRTLEYVDLAALNVGPDLFDVQCSSFAGWGSMTTDGNTITGRNFEWIEIPGVFEKQCVIVDVATAGSELLGFVTINWPGSIGCFSAMNEEGVTLNINDTNGYPPRQTSGFHPRILTYREAIESAHAATALKDVKNVLNSRMTKIPQNLMITVPYSVDNQGSVVFEYDGDISVDNGATVREPEKSKCYQICTNHCRKRKPPIICPRYSLLSEQLESIATSGGARHLTREKAWELLESAAQGNRTHHRVIFEPNKKLMHVALSVALPAPQYNAVTLNVSALLEGTNLFLAREGNFTGIWSLNKDISRVPNTFPDVKIEILQNGNKLQYEEVGSTIYQMSLATDGKEHEYTSGRGNKLRCSAQFENNKLTIISTREAMRSGGLFFRDVKQEFELFNDGKNLQLVQVDVIKKLNERQERKLIFDKL